MGGELVEKYSCDKMSPIELWKDLEGYSMLGKGGQKASRSFYIPCA